MRRAIEAKQKELDAMQGKMALPVDTEIIKLGIQKNIEGRHRAEID